MPPYEPLYVKKAKQAEQAKFKEWLRVIDLIEERSSSVSQAYLNQCEASYMEAVAEKDKCWERWQAEQADMHKKQFEEAVLWQRHV